ncbi:MAG: glycosyltransferase family 4 protein [Phycisphaeraceae bacterium]|nr:glycosyltransferase family 4 protein [Phycisphaeraceae bacterium]
MNIAILIERYDPGMGSMEAAAAELTGLLAGRGHAVTILAATVTPDVSVPAGVTMRPMIPGGGGRHGWRMGALRLWRFHRWAKEQLANGSFDVSLSLTSTVPAMVLMPWSGVQREALARLRDGGPLTMHNWIERHEPWVLPRVQVLLWLERRTLRDAGVRRRVAASTYVREQIAELGRVAEDRVEVIRRGTGLTPLDDRERAAVRESLRAAWGVGGDTTLFLFAARDLGRQGLEPALRALAMLRAQGADSAMILAGPLSYRVLRVVGRCGVREGVRIVGATTRRAELLAAADVTVAPIFFDAASAIVIESLACGVPVIGSAFDGSSDWLDVDEVIADPRNVPALAAAMKKLVDPQERRRVAGGLVRDPSLLGMERVADEVERVLSEEAKTAAAIQGGAGIS